MSFGGIVFFNIRISIRRRLTVQILQIGIQYRDRCQEKGGLQWTITLKKLGSNTFVTPCPSVVFGPDLFSQSIQHLTWIHRQLFIYLFILHHVYVLPFVDKWNYSLFKTVNVVVPTCTSCNTIHFIRSVSFSLWCTRVRYTLDFVTLSIFVSHLTINCLRPPTTFTPL